MTETVPSHELARKAALPSTENENPRGTWPTAMFLIAAIAGRIQHPHLFAILAQENSSKAARKAIRPQQTSSGEA